VFSDRVDAGKRLAGRLAHLRGDDVVVVGLPRGGVPVAAEVARALDAPLDVIVVRKLGVPFQPELGMGALGEDGVKVLNPDVIAMAGVTDRELAAVEARESAELQRRAERFRAGRERVPLTGRVVVVVDDGVATGSTARAACEVARAHGAARVVLAVPVAPVDWTRRLADAADELVCVATPTPFFGIGQFYDDFSQTTDDEVVRHLRAAAAPAAPTSPESGRPVSVTTHRSATKRSKSRPDRFVSAATSRCPRRHGPWSSSPTAAAAAVTALATATWQRC
jgi:putative phosphoribosyl transferase